jgi:hypothetical protein
MQTTGRTPTPKAAARESRPREIRGALTVLIVAVVGLITAAWVFVLVLLALWLTSAIF